MRRSDASQTRRDRVPGASTLGHELRPPTGDTAASNEHLQAASCAEVPPNPPEPAPACARNRHMTPARITLAVLAAIPILWCLTLGAAVTIQLIIWWLR